MASARSLDVLVVGAGQAGLAAGERLSRTPLSFLIVDGASRIGESWRRRWDSLRLFTPAGYSSLPGLPLPGDPMAYPTKDVIADYLEHYAEHFGLPVQLESRVTRLERRDTGFHALLESRREISARAVIVASGAFQVPAVPGLAAGLAASVVQLTPNTYRNPRSMEPGTVLVVGDGATGRQIALELSDSHRVLLAAGRSRRVSPDQILGRSLFWWLDTTGIMRASRDSPVGRYLQRTDPFPGRRLGLERLAQHGVGIRPRVAAASGPEVTFTDGSRERVASVVWSTGYRDETGWIAVAGALDREGGIIEWQGASPVPGLMYLGRSWQRSRGSALLAGVGSDAELVVESVRAGLSARCEELNERAAGLPRSRRRPARPTMFRSCRGAPRHSSVSPARDRLSG